MKQFNLSEWLKDKSRKVTTRLGNREVRIICWDRKDNNNRPIITLMIDPDGNEYTTFHTKNGWCDEKEKYIDKRDLFFADEEGELTEFEKELNRIVTAFSATHAYMDEIEIHHYSKGLLDLAREELQPEIDKEIDKAYKNIDTIVYDNGYKQGQYEIMEDLPKWKKAEKDEELDCHVAIQQDGKVVLSDFVQKDEYYITLDVLKTLPKEE
jgi:hypothetical protein